MFINYFVEKKIRKMNIIRSNNHEIYSYKVNKVALSSNDNNSFWWG